MLKPGSMYALDADWPHRGPTHAKASKADRVVLFMSVGNQPTDTSPIFHAEYASTRMAGPVE